MSKAGNSQKRTTYLISLTLVKVEAVPENVDGAQVENDPLPGGEGSPKKEEVSNAAEKEEGPACADVVEKENKQLGEVEQVQVKYDSPTESRGKPERRETQTPNTAHSPAGPQKDFGKKEIPLLQPTVKQPVKVYGGTTSEGGVRREGPRSDAQRPKTEIYREPPVLFLKGENGADLNSRSRCSLPFSVLPPVSQRPDVLMRSHAAGNSACWRELREANTSSFSSAKTLDRRDNRFGEQSPIMAATTLGPYRASWADSDGRGTLIRPGAPMSGGYAGIMSRDSPQGDRLKAVSAALPALPAPDLSRPQRKGTSRTLDNSDLHCLSEDLKKGKEGQGGAMQRAPPRDRKMLKFISGIFSKSTTVPPSNSTVPLLYPSVERGSSEEEGKRDINSFHTTAEKKNKTKQFLHDNVVMLIEDFFSQMLFYCSPQSSNGFSLIMCT